MKLLALLIQDRQAVAAAEMALVAPFLIILMFGTVEIGNYFLTEHAVVKQVRDGARYGSRLTLADDYSCAAGSDLSTIFKSASAGSDIVNVTQTGSVDGSATGRFGDAFWTTCPGSATPVSVNIRCVDKDSYGGIYSTLDGDIPVLTVSANVAYPSLLGAVGFDATSLCLRAESEAAVYGI